MQITDLFDTAQVLALIGGIVIPFVVAFLSRQHASANVQTALAVVVTGLLALGAYLTNLAGAHTLKGAISVFVIAAVTAAASRVTFTQQYVTAVHQGTPGVVGTK